MDFVIPSLPQDDFSLEQQVARLQALLEASRQVHSTIRVGEVLTQAAKVLVQELEMEGALFLDPHTTTVTASWGNAPHAPYENSHRLPLLSKEKHVLAELIMTRPDAGPLSLYEEDFLEGLMLQTAVALENATLHERDLKWARVQQDLDAARTIQRSLLPSSMPQISGFSIAGRSNTCYEVGGDYLDTILLPDGTHLMVVADVAGKGLASAIVATSFRAALRSLASQPLALDELAARICEQHWGEGEEAQRRYVTAIFLRLEPDNGEIKVVNAGHNPGALLLPNGKIHLIEASGTPLGMLPRVRYTVETLAFPKGSRVLLYTDGMTEVFRGEEEFGTDRLVAAFSETSSSNAGTILDSVWDSVNKFSCNAVQSDDMTALAICHLNSSQQEFAAR